jgi:exodeoxyribonuclease VII large subunit
VPTENSPDKPLPVRTVARLIADWVGRLGRVWLEGQVTEITRRPGLNTVFLTLRDPAAEVSLQVTCPRALCDRLDPPLAPGARVVMQAQPTFYLQRGSLTLTALDIRPVGLGELLARIERLKGVLAAEGLFAPERKRPLPFLPRGIGLITGRASAAARDVVQNASARWPGATFVVREVAVQGPAAVGEVVRALRELDRDPQVDVVVIARGGGSVEDLLAFSDETLLREVSAATTPVVSAIGHEQDAPLLDLVADVRASTPTDAGKRVVPDVGEELARLARARRASLRCLLGRLDAESAHLRAVRSRPCLARPLQAVAERQAAVLALRERSGALAGARLAAAAADLAHARARVGALSPAATLARGYAVLQAADGSVLRDAAGTRDGERLRARLAVGELAVVVAGDPGSVPE